MSTYFLITDEAVNAYCNRGNAYFKLGKYKKAVNDYTKAISLQPDADVYYNRAIVYLHLGKKEKAQKDFEQAARLGHPKANQKSPR